MTIETKYSIGDEVYIILDNSFTRCYVVKVEVTVSNSEKDIIYYFNRGEFIQGFTIKVKRPEKSVWKSKEDFLTQTQK